MKNLTAFGAVFLAAFALATVAMENTCAGMDCIEGSGVSRQQERKLTAFSMLDVSGVFDVHLIVGSPQQVILTADDNILEHIRTEVRNGTLIVDSKRSICVKTDLRLEIRVPEIKAIEVDGSVTLHAAKITGPSFSLSLDGSSDATVQGSCRRFEVDLLGSTSLEAETLKAAHVSIRVTGSGDASVYASQRLDAKISGVGTVTYSGNPSQINPEIMGVGDLVPR